MAYLILSTGAQEWDRRELTGPVVLGRSPDCDISVHDILLSRRHCRLTPTDDGWLVIDLASRNGTRVGNQPVEQMRLKHGDVIRAGKSKITFRDGAMVKRPSNTDRPQIPTMFSREELLAGTVAGMSVPTLDAPSTPRGRRWPTPKPRPMDPVSFADDDLYGMLEQIASCSWDSVYAINVKPVHRSRQLPQPMVNGRRHGHTAISPPIPNVNLPIRRGNRMARWTRGPLMRVVSSVRALLV